MRSPACISTSPFGNVNPSPGRWLCVSETNTKRTLDGVELIGMAFGPCQGRGAGTRLLVLEAFSQPVFDVVEINVDLPLREALLTMTHTRLWKAT